ncbi:hypothetical protein Ciccas_001914, partial [Cichlidogyrus casuarinus]
ALDLPDLILWNWCPSKAEILGTPLECANYCLNGGYCVDSVNQPKCFCTPGSQGQRCELDFDDCLPNVSVCICLLISLVHSHAKTEESA